LRLTVEGGCFEGDYLRRPTFPPSAAINRIHARFRGLTNQGNRRPPRRAAPPVGVRVDRVVRPS
jgi:hypothetical protein